MGEPSTPFMHLSGVEHYSGHEISRFGQKKYDWHLWSPIPPTLNKTWPFPDFCSFLRICAWPWMTPEPHQCIFLANIIAQGVVFCITTRKKGPKSFQPSSNSPLTRHTHGMSFRQFCHVFAPPWHTPTLHHIFCSGLNYHFRSPSMQQDLDIRTLAFLTPSLKPKFMTAPNLWIATFLASFVHPHGWPHDPPASFF